MLLKQHHHRRRQGRGRSRSPRPRSEALSLLKLKPEVVIPTLRSLQQQQQTLLRFSSTAKLTGAGQHRCVVCSGSSRRHVAGPSQQLKVVGGLCARLHRSMRWTHPRTLLKGRIHRRSVQAPSFKRSGGEPSCYLARRTNKARPLSRKKAWLGEIVRREGVAH